MSRSPRHNWVARLFARLTGGLLIIALAVLAPTGWVMIIATPHIDDVENAPDAPVALVLGAAVWNGVPSPFLAGRLDVALELYRAGKVRAILVSGDNRAADYDEPSAMARYLVDRGIPAGQIVKDPAGNNTYDSCVRARDVYDVTELIVVTQDYHVPRSVAACRMAGLEASGVGDSTAREFRDTWWWGVAREVPANGKLVIDLVTRRQPTPSPTDPSLSEAVARQPR